MPWPAGASNAGGDASGNILDASVRGHYDGRPFAGGAIDFASVTRDGIELRQLNVALADAA